MASARTPLCGPARWLITIGGLFALSVALSNTFVNVYLWKVDKSFTPIGWYNLGVYSLIPIMFWVAGMIAKRKHSVLTLRLGILFHICFYAVTLFGGTRIAGLPYILGALLGTAAGFYWCAFNELSLRFTESGSRDRFYGMNGVVGSVSGMIAPVTAGYLISFEDRFGGLSGYHLVFGLSLCMFVLALLTTTRLRAKNGEDKLRFAVIRSAWQQAAWRRILYGSLVYGLREGLFLFLVGLLMYIASGSELELGQFLLLQSGLSFISFFVVGRIVHAESRIKVQGIGAIAMAMSALVFLLPLRTINLVIYGSAIAVCLPLFLVPLQGVVFDTIGRLDKANDGDTQLEHIITREFFSNAGRVVGIVTFLIWVRVDPSGRSIPYLAVVFGFVQLATWALFRSAMRSGSGGKGSAMRVTSTNQSERRGARVKA